MAPLPVGVELERQPPERLPNLLGGRRSGQPEQREIPRALSRLRILVLGLHRRCSIPAPRSSP